MKYYPQLDESENKVARAKNALIKSEHEKKLLELEVTKLQKQYDSESSSKLFLQKHLIEVGKEILQQQGLLEEKTTEQRKQEAILEQRESDINSDENRIKYLQEKAEQSYILMQQLANTRSFHAKVASYASMPFENSLSMNKDVINQEESDIIGQILADSDYQ